MGVAIVTGASSGIGLEFARQLSKGGYKVGMIARRMAPMEDLADEIRKNGGYCSLASADVGDATSLKEAVAKIESELGPCDLVIANAGQGHAGRVEEFNMDLSRQVYDTNLIGLMNTVSCVMPGMIKRRSGHVVGISSLAAYLTTPDAFVYSSSKAAASSYLAGLRLAMKRFGIKVTTICPGFIETPMTARNRFKMPFLMGPEEAVGRMIRSIERGDKVYNFPKRLYWVIRCVTLLPDVFLGNRLSSGR